MRFGERLKDVPLLAPDSIVVPALSEQYGPYVTPALLQTWIQDPKIAPGRETSSPWPDRIEVRSVTPAGDGGCRVEGEVVYLTSVEATAGEAAARMPVALAVRHGDGWQIAAVELATSSDAAPAHPGPADATPADEATSPVAAADVVRRYYEAIAAGDYRRAYALWADEGAASGQTFDPFAAGIAHTAHVEADVGEPGRVEPAAGSRYVDVPVVIRAQTDEGERQRFEGRYTLRRAVVDGATPAQRSWHLHAADLARVEVP